MGLTTTGWYFVPTSSTTIILLAAPGSPASSHNICPHSVCPHFLRTGTSTFTRNIGNFCCPSAVHRTTEYYYCCNNISKQSRSTAKMSALSFIVKHLESSYDNLNGSQEIYKSSTVDHQMTVSDYPATSVVDIRRNVYESRNPASGSPYYSSLKHADGSPYEDMKI